MRNESKQASSYLSNLSKAHLRYHDPSPTRAAKRSLSLELFSSLHRNLIWWPLLLNGSISLQSEQYYMDVMGFLLLCMNI